MVGVAAASLFALSGCLSLTQNQVHSELNADRGAQRLRTLSIQSDAQAKAQAWAEKLARENKLYHSTLSDGIRTRWCALGENVGYGANVPVAGLPPQVGEHRRIKERERVYGGGEFRGGLG